MRFTKLRLMGFKSFVEPTDFIIENGLTGVVGPNGCGKSNLVEALRWVMGENSYKNMRASGMDDVIFSGSANRPSRNNAEVALYLDNKDRTAPATYNDADELQVSRRIERESGSNYRINGKEARAKDVQLLFADQSTGARSPSMVGQGRVGELIQAKPQARRALLEEAAGISGLHSRRHEAELRLRAAETNLTRLDDVVSELQSQIESLKRQARQASRFKSLSNEVREAEATVLHIRWQQAQEQENEAKSAVTTATTAVAAEMQSQLNAAKDQGVGAHKLPELREAEVTAAATLQRLKIAKEQLEAEAKRLAGRRQELERRVNQLTADIEREKALLADSGKTIERLGQEQDDIKASDLASADRETMAKVALATANATVEKSEAAFQKTTSERAEAAATRQQAERAEREASERFNRAQSQITKVEGELQAIQAKLDALPDIAACQALYEEALHAQKLAETAVTDAEKHTELARNAEFESRPKVQEAQAALKEIETEARTLRGVLGDNSGELFPAIVDAIKVRDGFETALGAALGDDLETPEDANAPAFWSGADITGDDPKLPQNAEKLANFVDAPQVLQRRLAQIGVVASLEVALSLLDQLKTGQRLVTKAGDVVRWDGLRISADAPTPAAMRLAQKNRLATLDDTAIEATKLLRRAEELHRTHEEALNAARQAERSTRDQLKIAQKDVTSARDAQSAAERSAGEFSARHAALKESLIRHTESRDEARQEQDRARAASHNLPDLSALEAALQRLTTDLATDRANTAKAQAEFNGLVRDKELRAKRLAAIDQERQSWTSRIANAEKQSAILLERQEEAAQELATLDDAPEQFDHKRRELMNALSEAEAKRKAAADALASAENHQRNLDKNATDAIQKLASARELRARAEERVTAAQERREDVQARIQERFNCAPIAVFKLTGLNADDPLPDPNAVEKQLERFKIERERLGAVNLRAEEEQTELTERLNLIESERGDVVEAIKKLRSAIQDLNKEGRERLLVAFDQVNEQFTRLFTHLFGGGTAELQLIESDDPLEAGLEILARPPGKRPQTMTLLSGGEQALTAMALIFAVFLTNPAPICVLDEVDAPLDDHNVERFCNLMDEMSKSTDTRFVIITHNPITMARVDRLFGVTMAEQGVSQLVSVDLKAAEELREAS